MRSDDRTGWKNVSMEDINKRCHQKIDKKSSTNSIRNTNNFHG